MAFVELTAGWVGLALFGLGLLHVYWGFGGSRLREVATPRVGGRPTAEPSGFAFFAVAAGLWAAGLLSVSRIGWFAGRGLHGGEAGWFWMFAGLFALRALGDFRLIGVFCRCADAAHRRFERHFAVPICAFLAIGFVRLALHHGPG